MLADPRARRALVDNFAGQWLELRNIREHTPDPDIFDEFDENLREAIRRETELFIDSQLAADRSVVDLLTADYTFVNERLARHYGIPDVYGERFRRVTLDAAQDHARGLLGHGSLLTVTSYPNRTSPVLRGKWLLENILGAPPPPPPPDVPDARRTRAKSGRLVSVRERLEEHRRTRCAPAVTRRWIRSGSRSRISTPSAAGARPTEGDSAIDASGSLPDGSQFEGPAGLRALLLARRQQFVTTVTEKLLTYALGRAARVTTTAGRPQDRPRRRRRPTTAGRPSFSASSQSVAVSDEESGIMIITKKTLSRADGAARPGRGAGAAAARRHGAGLRARRGPPRPRRCGAWASSTCRTG